MSADGHRLTPAGRRSWRCPTLAPELEVRLLYWRWLWLAHSTEPPAGERTTSSGTAPRFCLVAVSHRPDDDTLPSSLIGSWLFFFIWGKKKKKKRVKWRLRTGSSWPSPAVGTAEARSWKRHDGASWVLGHCSENDPSQSSPVRRKGALWHLAAEREQLETLQEETE